MLVRRRTIVLVVLCVGLAAALSACGSKEYPAELLEAKAAVADAKAEGADTSCPDEYSSAETKLAKAEALWEEGEDDEMAMNAGEAKKLAELAKDCAAGKKTASPDSLLGAGELPEELSKYQESILFDFNDNAIAPAEAAKLKGIANFIKAHQDKTKFWVILTCHADRPGSPQENFFLTRRRGVVARHFLIQQGVEMDRILIQPMGEYLAATKSAKENKDQKYRKVVITLYPYKPLPGLVEGSPYLPGPYNYYYETNTGGK